MKTKLKIPEEKWKWFGHVGHFIGGNSCRFHLCTKVGKYLVSTVGDYYTKDWLRGGLRDGEVYKRQPMGSFDGNDFFETMVFKVTKGKCNNEECGCGMPNVNWSDRECIRCSTGKEANKTHIKLCRKYAQ